MADLKHGNGAHLVGQTTRPGRWPQLDLRLLRRMGGTALTVSALA